MRYRNLIEALEAATGERPFVTAWVDKNLAFMALAAMHSGVAYYAERDQVLFGIGSRMAAELSMVHLKI